MTRARPAPIAIRTAISRRRATARASRTPATFADAMTRTTKTSARSSAKKPAATVARAPGTEERAATRSRAPRSAWGCSRSSSRAITSSSAPA